MARKVSFLLLLVITCLSTQGKDTYVPKYNSAISIAHQGDTIYDENKKAELVVDAQNGLFRVGIVHEVLTLKRIKTIKRMETAAGLSALAGVLYATSTVSPDWGTRIRGHVGAFASGALAGIYSYNANQEKRLGMDVVIDNPSSEELIVNDMERGLTWYVQPNSALTITAANPDVVQLRVSDLKHERIYFVQAGGGSVLKSANVEWEDEEYWAFPIDIPGMSIQNYVLISKATGERTTISKEELKAIKKKSKEKNK